MDKIKKVKAIGNIIGFNIDASGNETYNVQFPDMTIAELESYQFEEADAYRANENPFYLRNVLARLRGLPEHDRKVWMDEIMHEFANDYGVEREKRYEVSIKASGQYLARTKLKEIKFMYNGACSHLTRKELEDADFGWVFDCEGVEVQEVQEVE